MIRCPGTDCPFKETCFRFTADEKEFPKIWGSTPVFKSDNHTSGFGCMNWWPLPSDVEPPPEEEKKEEAPKKKPFLRLVK